MLLQVSHVVMVVQDLAACRAHYGDALNLAEIGQGVGANGRAVCLFRIGPTLLELQQNPAAPTTGPHATDQADQTMRPAINHLALYVDSIDRAYDSLKDRDIGLQGVPHTTAVGHRNMQRALLAFTDPNGFTVQISETIDSRSHLEGRRTAKRNMAASQEASGLFGGIDHISMYCTDFSASRAFYTEKLGLEEFFHSTTREPGETVAPGFEQGAFAVGGTDIELATDETWRAVEPGTIRQLGFSTADIDQAYELLKDRGIQPDSPPSEWTPLPEVRQRAFTLRGPDGLTVQIAQS